MDVTTIKILVLVVVGLLVLAFMIGELRPRRTTRREGARWSRP